MADTLGYSIFLEPTDVVRAFEQRGEMRPTVRWHEMMHQDHASHFTVAKIAKLDLLRSVYASLDDVLRNGGTYEGWRRNIVPELQKAGWWGSVTNPELTGTTDTIFVGERRLRTIYNTNVRMSMAAGHWTRIQRQKKEFPYLRYVPSISERRRQLHMAWYDIILPVDHPFWQTHFPPNGWGCKCGFEQVTERRMKRMGWKITPDADIPGGPTGLTGGRTFFPASGQPVIVPQGIDPGFGYNPGTANLRAIANKATASIEKALDAGLFDAASTTLRQIVADPAFAQFLALPDGDFPIALLNDADRQRIGSATSLVLLPGGVFAKQLRSHPELTIAAYRLLPDIISSASVIIQQDISRVIYIANRDAKSPNRWWKAVVRQDAGRTHPAVVSYQPADDRELAREARKGEIILDRRGE